MVEVLARVNGKEIELQEVVVKFVSSSARPNRKVSPGKEKEARFEFKGEKVKAGKMDQSAWIEKMCNAK
jgi:hypothetical protein